MNSAWSQFLAAIVAAVIPVVVKLLNDWHDRLTPPVAAVKESPPGDTAPPLSGA